MTHLEMTTTTLKRLGEAAGVTGYHRKSQVTTVLNQVQRLFVLLTLCLERTGTFTLSGGPCYHLLDTFSDYLLPLRVRMVVSGVKLKHATFSELAALDPSWSVQTGTPSRYATSGFDLFAVYKQPASALTASITFARAPAELIYDADIPEAPEEYHQNLIDGAIALIRVNEGAQEWQKEMPLWDRYLEAAGKLADYMRARNQEQAYDRMPFELKRLDRSRLLKEVANG